MKNMKLIMETFQRFAEGQEEVPSPEEAKEAAVDVIQQDPEIVPDADPKEIIAALQKIAKADLSKLETMSEGENHPLTLTALVPGLGATGLAVVQMLEQIVSNSQFAHLGYHGQVMNPSVVQNLAIGLLGLGAAGLSALLEKSKGSKGMTETRKARR